MPAAAEASIAQLRGAMVDQVMAKVSVSAAVEAAMRRVPRDLFLPDASTEEAYKDRAVVTKRGLGRSVFSSVPQPSAIAAMLEQLQVEPGHRILEVGSGGYNAALLAELTGPAGSVVTIDIDHSVISRTRACLRAAGCTGVTALVNDGHLGFPPRGPYERIIVTAETPDIPPAWIGQLVDGGRIVVPLQIRGLSRTVGFTRRDEILVSDSIQPYSLTRMHRAGAPRRTTVTLAGGVRLDVSMGQDVDADALRDALTGRRHMVWSGVALPADSLLPGLELWLATVQPVYGRLQVSEIADQQEPVAPTIPAGVSAVWSDDTIAYLTFKQINDSDLDIGVVAYGPDRFRLADLLVYDVQIWDAERRGGPDPTIRVYPSTVVWESLPPGRLIDTPSAQIMITWD